MSPHHDHRYKKAAAEKSAAAFLLVLRRTRSVSSAKLTPNRDSAPGSLICSIPASLQSVSSPVPTRTYDLFERAMRARKQVVCTYGGFLRELCPIILGHSQGQEKALTFQFAGQSSSGLPEQGEWRCLWLSKVADVKLREGPWFVGSSHTQPQGCVEVVDLDVNPSSPYRPKRSL